MPSSTTETTLVASIAGEDIQCGDFVTIAHETVEFASFLWCDAVTRSPEEPVRVRFIPSDAGLPYKVIGVCLPFVYTKNARDIVETFDLRQCQLVRLNKECAETIWKAMKPKPLSKKKSK